jgi:hypothetical protein
MIKKIILSIGLLMSVVALAQESTSSPYSFYGIGDVKFKGTGENRMMGGVAVFKDSLRINLQNPASFAHLSLTAFAIGGTYNNNKLKTESASEEAKRTALDYLAVGLPLGKFGAAFGLLPYSAIGYKIKNENSTLGASNLDLTGTGGINKVFAGVGYQIMPNLSIGADVQYNFGQIETKSIEYITGVENGTGELNTSNASGVTFNTGLMYNRKITSKLNLYTSLTYSPESKITLTNERNISILTQTGSLIEEQDIAVANTKIVLPSKVSFGAGIGEEKKWAAGAQVVMQQSSDMSNRFPDINNVEFENSTAYSFGGYYIPNYNSYSSYFKRVTYRAGFRFENTGLVIQDKPIEDYAFTLGTSLPIGNSVSNLNIGLEFGKKGTVYTGLVRENYINLSFGLSISDRWFVKRKYD